MAVQGTMSLGITFDFFGPINKSRHERVFIMAVVTVEHNPKLEVEEVMKVFQRHFTGKYVVYKANLYLWGRDFAVKKSAWVGVSVKLKQETGKTSFVFTGFMPSVLVRVLFGGLIALLILQPSLKAMENEVKSFIESADELNRPCPQEELNRPRPQKAIRTRLLRTRPRR